MSLFENENHDHYFDYDAIATKMQERLRLHHNFYESRCKDTFLEENFHRSLQALGIPSVWKPGNHNVKFDIQISGLSPDIGVKSGALDYTKNLISYSGSRLGSHKTIQDKVSFLERNKPYFTFFMAEKKNCPSYFFCVLQNSKICYDVEWIKKDSGYHVKTDGCSFKIQKSMSWQLWSEIDLRLLSYIKEIDI